MQIKTALRFHLIPFKMAISRKQTNAVEDEVVGENVN
jgi:hypothetical protein